MLKLHFIQEHTKTERLNLQSFIYIISNHSGYGRNSVIGLFIPSPLSIECSEDSIKYKYLGVTVIIEIKLARKLTTD